MSGFFWLPDKMTRFPPPPPVTGPFWSPPTESCKDSQGTLRISFLQEPGSEPERGSQLPTPRNVPTPLSHSRSPVLIPRHSTGGNTMRANTILAHASHASHASRYAMALKGQMNPASVFVPVG